MIFGIYSIRDHLTGFMTPVIEQSDAAALRNFALAVNRFPKDQGHSLYSWRPADFDFFKLGDFNSETGEIVPSVPPVLVSSGLSVKEGDADV